MTENQSPDNGSEFLTGADGQPLLDRFGRPIRRRPQSGNGGDTPRRPQARPKQQPSQPSGQQRGPSRGQQPVRDPRLDPDQIRRRAEQDRRAQQQRPQQKNETRMMPAVGSAGAAGAAGAAAAAGAASAGARPQQAWSGQYKPGDARRDNRPPRRPDQPRGVSPGGRGEPPQEPPRKRRKLRAPKGGCMPRRPIRMFLLVVVLLVVAMLAFIEVNINRTEVFSDLDNRPSRTMTSNWLLVGSDSRAGMSEEENEALSGGGEIDGNRTDTIMIASVPIVGKPTLLSIPRDSYVDIPGVGMEKINAAFAYGGAPLLTETVEQTTGIRIDHYAEIGLGGFANIVDAAGGVEMCPDEAIDDPLAGLNIQAGCQEFDGPSALGYVRTRATAMGDLDRVDRQREFMGAIMGRMRSPAVLLNPFRAVPVAAAGTGSMTLGDGDHSWHLTWLMLRMALGANSETVPVGGFGSLDVGDVVYWDEGAAEQLFSQLR